MGGLRLSPACALRINNVSVLKFNEEAKSLSNVALKGSPHVEVP